MHFNYHEILQITRTLLKFLREHKHPNERCVDVIEECLLKLEGQKEDAAYKAYEHFRSSCGLGRMGCFDDIGVSVVYEHETSEYVDTIYRSLLIRWAQLMMQLAPDVSNK